MDRDNQIVKEAATRGYQESGQMASPMVIAMRYGFAMGAKWADENPDTKTIDKVKSELTGEITKWLESKQTVTAEDFKQFIKSMK